MIAVDVKTGKLVLDFGVDGYVDLKASVSVDGGKGSFGLPSPPAVYRNIVITGGTNGEGAPGTGRLYGDIRGWDARTGKMLWTFHTVPRPGEPGCETWPEGAYKNRSGTNAWGFMTVDVERGLVFVPLGSPTADFYGADRHGNNLYGNSLVALDAPTGKVKWYQQLVHHDLWDYDPAAPPDAHRGAPRRPDHSGRRADHEDGHALHVQSRDRRADLRHGGAPGAADRRPRRMDREDAAVSDQARAAGADEVRSGEGLLHADPRTRRLVQEPLGQEPDDRLRPVCADAARNATS